VVDREVVRRKVASARANLEEAESLAQRSQITNSKHDRDLAAFYLFLAVQDAIDLTAHWLADAGWHPPAEAGEAFDVLAAHEAISGELASAMHGAVGLRNRIAHGYAGIDHQRIFAELPDGARHLRAFLVAVAEAAGI